MPFLLQPTGGADGYAWMSVILAVFVLCHTVSTFTLRVRATNNVEAMRGDEAMELDHRVSQPRLGYDRTAVEFADPRCLKNICNSAVRLRMQACRTP